MRWIILLFAAATSLACPREPSIYHSRVDRIPGDNGFQIKIKENPEKYVPGQVYTMYLMAPRTLNQIKQFKRFTINVESTTDPGNLSPQTVGTFQLFGDLLSKFNEDCVNTISEVNDANKSEIFFMWTAPPPGSGCVTFRAMVFQNSLNWYSDDGTLSKTFCEISEKDVKYDENDCCACDEAKYSVIFEGIWSNKTHPKDYPFSLWLTHFSDVIGASHERNFSFWGEGQYASEGFRSLAEWGSVRLMETELRAKSKYLRTIIKAAGLWYPKVNTNTTANFKVDRRHHLVSLSSMFGPSPDWVVGVNGLNLCLKNCTWIENLIVDLYPYDAGTDGGITYMSPNLETKPREKMYRITTKYPEDPRAPFYNMQSDTMNPLARLYFTREKIVPKSCDENFLNAQIDISENTEEDTERPECAVTDYTAWSDCSVTCGKGLRMRTREYKMPQKAQMFGCSRQLVSKEMCVASVPECEGGEQQESSEEQIEYNDAACATTEWSKWTECSETCGIGFKTRSRQFIDFMGRKKCPTVETLEREKCMGPPCTAKDIEDPDSMCPISPWSDWSPCSATCGTGVKVRTRLFLVEPELQQKCAMRRKILEEQQPCVEIADCSFDMQTAKRVCMEDSEPGPCPGQFNRWYFESRKLMCVPFIYGGCRGNRNNFITLEECNSACSVVRDTLSGGSISSQLPANPAQFDMQTAKRVCMEESNSGTCRGQINRWYFESRKLMCVPFIYGGCGGNSNNFVTQEECNSACSIVRDVLSGGSPQEPAVSPPAQFDMQTAKRICMEESESGPCLGNINRWYFESRKLMCVPFIYGGCRGNNNNFATQEECNRACSIVKDGLNGGPISSQQPPVNPPTQLDMQTAKRICMQENEPGPCGGQINRWYFETRKLMCVPFIYGGCGGNSNNFATQEECNIDCSVVREALSGGPISQQQPPVTPPGQFDMQTAKRVCMEDNESGPCRGQINRWYFESRKLKCLPFIYSGCGGNDNNFVTQEECTSACSVVREALSGATITSVPPPTNPSASFGYERNSPQTTTEPDLTPVDCTVSEWSIWSQCSSSCGLAYAERFRIIRKYPQNGGKPCPKRLTARKRCIQLPAC